MGQLTKDEEIASLKETIERLKGSWEGSYNYQAIDWLRASVTQDGEGYLFASPAGSVLKVSNEHRKRLVLCYDFLKHICSEDLETLMADPTYYANARNDIFSAIQAAKGECG